MRKEMQNGTDPLKVDTDGDGLEDDDEEILQVNPLLKDSNENGIEDGEEYYKQMKDVLSFKLFYSQEEITVSIYNIVRIDSDLSSLILKVHKNKQKDIESMVYLADQIETLENVLNRMSYIFKKLIHF